MTAGSPDEQESPGALHRLAREVTALRAAAGNPSLRDLETLIRANERNDFEATASRQTISVIVNARQRTRLDTLRAVVLQLLRMDGTCRTTKEEHGVWARFEALWCDALREETSGAEPEATAAAQRFASRLRAGVLTPLGGDLAVLSGRLRELLPAGEPEDGMAPATLASLAQGTRTPRRRELELLLGLLARDGRPLSREDRQALMLDYIELLRCCDPDLYSRFMTEELLDAYRAHSAAEREERLRQKLSHRAEQARLTARLKTLESDRAEAVGALVTLREERDRLAALAAPQQPQDTPEPTGGVPPWNSLAPTAVIADLADPDTQYGYSASSYDFTQWATEAPAHDPYGSYGSYGYGSYGGYGGYDSPDTYAPAYYAVDPTPPYPTPPNSTPAYPTTELDIGYTAATQNAPEDPPVVPPAVPPVPVPPPSRRLLRAVAAVFRRGGDGRHRIEEKGS